MDKLKILLINPPIRTDNPPYNIPLGLACIAAVIHDRGYDVAIFDNNAYRLPISELIREIRNISWDMVCVGNLVTTYPWQRDLFRELRKVFPGAILQAGGGLATSLRENLLEWIPEIDVAVLGEGERTESEILDHIPDRDWSRVKGICYREDGVVLASPPQKLLTEAELSMLPFPKVDLLPLEEVYFRHSGIPLCPEALMSKRRISIEASRGCPFTCSFCIDLPAGKARKPREKDQVALGEGEGEKDQERKIRYFDPERVVDHILHLRLKYALDFISFTDENFTVNHAKVMEFCDLMEEHGLHDLEPRMHFSTTAHVNTINREILDRLKTVGCAALDLGFESMNKEILERDICKHATPDRNAWAFQQCVEAGIYPITNFLIGLPGESAQSVYDTTKFLVDNGIDCGPFFVTPYPMTTLFERCREKILGTFGSLENFVIACTEDVSSDFVINLTGYNDAELLGLRQMMMNHDVPAILKFSRQKGEVIHEDAEDRKDR